MIVNNKSYAVTMLPFIYLINTNSFDLKSEKLLQRLKYRRYICTWLISLTYLVINLSQISVAAQDLIGDSRHLVIDRMAFRHNALLEAGQQCPAKQRKKKLFFKASTERPSISRVPYVYFNIRYE
jgi:hypothetical protein